MIPAPVRPGPQNRSYVGLSLENGNSKVSQVADESPAKKAGIKAGDKLLMVGDAKISTVADLLKVVQSTEPGTEVKVQLQRGEEMLTLSVKLAAPPE
jgi:S1-C subfamily serine protease